MLDSRLRGNDGQIRAASASDPCFRNAILSARARNIYDVCDRPKTPGAGACGSDHPHIPPYPFIGLIIQSVQTLTNLLVIEQAYR